MNNSAEKIVEQISETEASLIVGSNVSDSSKMLPPSISAEQRSNLDLGIIGNCTFSVLIDRQARIVWACLPR